MSSGAQASAAFPGLGSLVGATQGLASSKLCSSAPTFCRRLALFLHFPPRCCILVNKAEEGLEFKESTALEGESQLHDNTGRDSGTRLLSRGSCASRQASAGEHCGERKTLQDRKTKTVRTSVTARVVIMPGPGSVLGNVTFLRRVEKRSSPARLL